MNFKIASTILAISMLPGISPALAQTPEAEESRARADSEQAALEQAELREAYEQAVEKAQQERVMALEAVERAAQAQAVARAERAEAQESMNEARQAELAEMRKELSRAHEELRSASREVARMHRELDHRHGRVAPTHSLINLGDKAVIGVILGDATDQGVQVLGVSPDGPSERAGLEQGDVIVSMMGTPLADEDSGNARIILSEVMEGVKVGDEITVTVDRDGASYDYTVTAEKREPFAWQSIVRLPSVPVAPDAPDANVFIEHIKIPEIDEVALRAEVERIREDVDRARVIIETDRVMRVGEAPESYEYRFETMSEFGDDALRETSVWFGLPVTRGLKLAEINAGLGEYFKTDRGVLVLQAREDNHLLLKSGDVILQVGDKQVDKPSDVMRALREWEPGANIEIEIMRDRKDKKLDVVIPEKMLGFDFSPMDLDLHFNIHSSKD